MRRSATSFALALLLALLAAAPAPAASRLIIKGRGYGHGIGMSQFGAYGYATHGFGYRDILAHYYTQTTLGQVSPAPDIRVLLQGGRRVVVSGAVAGDDRALRPAGTYVATAARGRIVLRTSAGHRVGTFDPPLRLAAPRDGSVRLLGPAANGVRDGSYRGAIEVRPGPRGVIAVNALGLEDYVRGVVSAESPANWPAAALQAQAVAARTYAITSDVGGPGDGYDQYADTRSQMYKGVAAELPATDAAVASTRGQVVSYAGRPVTTYFFSTSGGHTENVEFSFLGALPEPWLKGVVDPFDGASPRHTWGPITLSPHQVSAKLHGLVRGGFRGVKVLQRGTSPRIVRAEVVGTHGVTPVTGPQLRQRFGLFDTWATFTYVSSHVKRPKAPAAATAPAAGDDPSGGTPASAARARAPQLVGTISRARRGQAVRVQQRVRGVWWTLRTVHAGAGGSYRATLPGHGEFRVRWGDVTGPRIRVR